MKKLISNPILHVVFFGFALAILLLLLVGPPTSGEDSKRVVITDSDIDQLRISWMRRWMREPTPEELRGQLEAFVREEVLYREALARGYDKDDMVVRRAMQQKMNFLGQSQVSNEEPTDAEIEAYFALRREQYRMPAVTSFAHIYFNADMRGEQTITDAEAALKKLADVGPELRIISRYGDRFLLQNYYVEQSEGDIRAVFGADFAAALQQIPANKWQGPIRSGYGYHLVYVYSRAESSVPDWQSIRQKIVQDMTYEARNAAQELFYTEILRNYQIIYRGEATDIFGGEESE